MRPFPFLLVPVFALLGYGFWPLVEAHPWLWPMILGLFALGRLGRFWAWACWFVFYATPLIGLLPSSAQMGDLPLVAAVPGWLLWCLIFTAPAMVLGRGRWSGLLGALCGLLLVVPPFGWWSGNSPMLAIGALFPQSGVAGVVLMWLACWAIAETTHVRTARWTVAALAVVTVILNASALARPPVIAEGWMGLETMHGAVSGMSMEKRIQVADFVLPREVAVAVTHERAQGREITRVFAGEGVVTERSEFSDDLWAISIKDLSVRVVAGEYRPVVVDGQVVSLVSGVAIHGPRTQSDQVLTNVSAANTFPGVMWKPWSKSGNFKPHSPNAPVLIDSYRTHISWCFESTLLWPHLLAGWNGADMMVSLENRWSTKGTVMESSQSAAAAAVARWLGAGLIRAINR